MKGTKALAIVMVLQCLIESANCYYQTFANFTSHYSAVFTVYDDPVYGPNSVMKVNLIYIGVPI